MYAASWFLGQGFDVYFPAVQQSAHDFVVAKGGHYQTVQVKTATRTISGAYGYVQCRTRLTNKYQALSGKEIADLWAVVYGAALWVIPGEAIDTSNLCLGCDRGITTRRQQRWADYRVID